MADDRMRIIDARTGTSALLEALRQRSLEDLPADVEEATRRIIGDVRERGDEALVEYGRRFDCPTLTAEALVVGPEEIEEAYSLVSEGWLGAFRRARQNIYTYHERLRQGSWLEDETRGVGQCLESWMKPESSRITFIIAHSQRVV